MQNVWSTMICNFGIIQLFFHTSLKYQGNDFLILIQGAGLKKVKLLTSFNQERRKKSFVHTKYQSLPMRQETLQM